MGIPAERERAGMGQEREGGEEKLRILYSTWLSVHGVMPFHMELVGTSANEVH